MQFSDFFFFFSLADHSDYFPQLELSFSAMCNSVLFKKNMLLTKIGANFLKKSVKMGSVWTLVCKDRHCRCRKRQMFEYSKRNQMLTV